MSLNLGQAVFEAAKQLQASDHFKTVVDGLLEQSRKLMNAALDAERGAREDAIGYARAMRDVWHQLEAARQGVMVNKVEKPGPRTAKDVS